MIMNLFRKMIGKKPKYRVKAWNIEHVWAMNRVRRNIFGDYKEYWTRKDQAV